MLDSVEYLSGVSTPDLSYTKYLSQMFHEPLAENHLDLIKSKATQLFKTEKGMTTLESISAQHLIYFNERVTLVHYIL